MQYEVYRDLDADANGAARLNGYGSNTTSFVDTNAKPVPPTTTGLK